jgi:hypothetical protein
MLAASLIAMVMALFPPWVGMYVHNVSSLAPIDIDSLGYHFILTPPDSNTQGRPMIDSGRLLAQFVLLAGLTLILLVVASPNRIQSQ